MSEIYSPGSIAGAQGPAGPAGSQGSVTTLESSLRPALVNLFNVAVAQQNYVTGSDGTVSLHTGVGGGPSWASNLLYCPGSTQLICNHYLADTGFGPGAFIQLFDANGTFLSVLSGLGGWNIAPGTIITLPGTQVYARVTLIDGPGGGVPPTNAMICAGSSAAPATVPSSFSSFAPYVSSVVDANIATALATAKSFALAPAIDVAEFIVPGNANLFDASAAVTGFGCRNDGTIFATGWNSGDTLTSGLVFCPGATAFICSANIYGDVFEGTGTTVGIQLFDAAKNYIGSPSFAGSGALAPITLPGTQTYIRFTINTNYGATAATTMVYAGQAGSLAPMTSTHAVAGVEVPGTPYIPFSGRPLINQTLRSTVKKASELGCALNCILATGATVNGNGATDDTAILNAFLATASATNPIKLVLDGCAFVTGLVIASAGNTTIEGTGLGSGLFLGAGSNQSVIRLGSGEGSGTAPSRAGSNLVLRDLTINPNGANQASNSYGLLVANCTRVLLDHVNFMQAFYYASVFTNCSGIVVRGCNFTSTGTGHDGVHLDGPIEDVLISDCVFSTGDDAIAINAPEGYSGDISRVAVVNCIFNNSLTVARIYTSITPGTVRRTRQVVFSNCVGRTQLCAFSLGINGPGTQSSTTADQIEDLLIENCDIMSDTSVQGLGWILVSDAVGLLQARGCVMRAPQSNASFVMFNGTSSVGHLVLADVTILRNADGYATPALVDNTGAASVGKLTVSGTRVSDEAGSSYAAIPAALNLPVTVAELVVQALDMDHFTACFSAASGSANVALLRGAGLLATGAQISDSAMDSNALYLSSNAGGAPSIKIGGVAKRLTLA